MLKRRKQEAKEMGNRDSKSIVDTHEGRRVHQGN